MALFSVKNERDLVVFSALAGETTASTFAASASAGEGALVTASGAAPTDQSKFYFLYKHLDGRIRASDVIDPLKITSYARIAADTEVLPSATVTVPTPTVGYLYEVIVKIMNDGSLGTEDIMFLTGSFIATTTTAADVATGLKNSLNAAQTRMGQTWFTVTTSTADLILTSTKLPFVTGKKDGRPLDFIVKATYVNPTDNAVTGMTTAYTAYVANPVSLNYLKDLEWQTRGAFADSYRGLGYPNDFAFVSDVVDGTTYELFEIAFYDGDRYDHAVQKSPRHLTVACASTAADALETKILTAKDKALPIATTTTLGVVSIGTGLDVSAGGEVTLSA